jgi:hypothetical protein
MSWLCRRRAHRGRPERGDCLWCVPACAALAGPAWPRSGPHDPIDGRSTCRIRLGKRFFIFNSFQIRLNARNSFQLQKSIETCIKITKLQNKFLWSPCTYIYLESLILLSISWYISVYNFMNPNIAKLIKKYLHNIMIWLFSCHFLSCS